MRKTKEILRLKFAVGLSDRKIAASCGIARSTVADALRRAALAGIGWPLPEGLSETALEQALFPKVQRRPDDPPRPLPQWSEIHQELHRKGVTLMLLWQEYKEQHPLHRLPVQSVCQPLP